MRGSSFLTIAVFDRYEAEAGGHPGFDVLIVIGLLLWSSACVRATVHDMVHEYAIQVP